jgi:hypothetical protein
MNNGRDGGSPLSRRALFACIALVAAHDQKTSQAHAE